LAAASSTVAGVLTAFLLPGIPGGTTRAQAAIEVQTSNGRYVIRLTRLAEDTATVEAELEALGLDVKIDFVPASPSVVGTLVAAMGGDGTEEFTPPSGPADPVPSISVPLEYDSQLTLYIARPAEAGEDYVTSRALGAESQGEALHGSHIFNMKVKEAIRVLQDRSLTVNGGTARIR
jgi:hypothetical protein